MEKLGCREFGGSDACSLPIFYSFAFTPTLHKYFYLFIFGIRKTVVFTATMLDAGYLMLDILEFPTSEIQKHPVSRNQYPGSLNITNDLHYNG